MIPERTLKKWRGDALNSSQKLRVLDSIVKNEPAAIDVTTLLFNELNGRILRLTQDLLDIQLMKKG